jgi:hypothetical protein
MPFLRVPLAAAFQYSGTWAIPLSKRNRGAVWT